MLTKMIFVHSALDDAGLSPYAFRVLGHLQRRGKYKTSVEAMVKICQISRSSAIRAIKELEERKFIQVTRKKGQPNTYTIREYLPGSPVSHRDTTRLSQKPHPSLTDTTPVSHRHRNQSLTDTLNNTEGYPIGYPLRESMGTPLCSIDEAKSSAQRSGSRPNIAEIWWHECDGRGWVDPKGHPIRNCESALKSICGKWQANEIRFSSAATTPSPQSKTKGL